MTISFLSPLLADFQEQVAKFTADIEAAAELAKQNILRELDGFRAVASAARSTPAPTLKAKGAAAKAQPAKGQKRTPEALALLTEEVFTVIQRHPGERIEQIAEHAGLTTKEMLLPIKRLREAKRLTVTGEKRATRYTAKASR